MIDRIARDELAASLRDLLEDRITSDALGRSARRSSDPAVKEVLAQVWILDREKAGSADQEAEGIGKEDRREISRWILFLGSDLPYRWPVLPLWARVVGFIPSILTFGFFWTPWRRWFERRGDHRFWPFFSEGEYRRAKRTAARPPQSTE